MNYNYNTFTGILRMTPAFRTTGAPREIEYRFDDDYTAFTAKYPIAEIAGNGTDFEKCKNLLFWLTAHTFHKGDFYDPNDTRDAADWLAHAYDNDAEHGINCLMLSQVLTECLLSQGIRARRVFLMPFSPNDGDNHVVTEAYAADLGRWVFLDPTYGAYVTDDDGIPLNVLEIRRRLAARKPLHFNAEANYNGTPIDQRDIEAYYAKDFAHFHIQPVQGRLANRMEERIYFAPIGFDSLEFYAATMEFRAEFFVGNPQFESFIDAVKTYREKIKTAPPVHYQDLATIY